MISVCMATYNGEKYIKEQLDSILKQLDSEDEVVISDDGSKDNTIQVVKSLDDPRIKIFCNKENHGFTHNFENALRNAKGDYIFLSDQDDIWMDDKIEMSMKALSKCDFIISDCITVDSELNVISESRFKEFDIKPGFLHHLLKSRFIGCCMAFRRCVLDASMPFPKNDNLVEHDIWLAAVGFLYFDTKLLDKQLIYYRRHGKNASDGGFTKGYSFFNKIYRRIYRLVMLVGIKNKVKAIKKTLATE